MTVKVGIALLFLVGGCGATQSSQVQLAKCKPKVAEKSSPAPGSLNLADIRGANDSNLGLGYVDISTDVGMVSQTRRCSMSLYPVEGKADHVRLTTAAHCGWPAESEEFAKSKNRLQIYYNGGYFPVSIELQGQQDWHAFAKMLSPYQNLLPAKFRKRMTSFMTDMNKQECLSLTSKVRSNAPSEADILCFSRSEMRTLVGKITVEPKMRTALDSVLAAAATKRNAVLDNFPFHEQMVFKAVFENPSPYEMLPAYLKELGFKLNPFFCSAPAAELPKEVNGDPETQELCSLRSVLLESFKKEMPQWWGYLQSSAEMQFGSYEEMRAFHGEKLRCAFASLDGFNPTADKPIRNSCDRDMLSWYVWRKWVKEGLVNLATLQSKNPKLNGFTPETFFSLHTNSFATRDDLQANNFLKSKPKHFLIDPNNGVFTFESAMAFALNPVRESLWISKKDSGSLFSIFGVVPAGVLSTYNGEPTSGGASILPLPVSVNSESVSSSDAEAACTSR